MTSARTSWNEGLDYPKTIKKNKRIIGYYDNVLIITGFIRTDKVFHLRSYWKKGNNSETTLDNPVKRKCKIALSLVKTHIVKKICNGTSFTKEAFAGKEIVCVSPHWDFSFSGRNLK